MLVVLRLTRSNMPKKKTTKKTSSPKKRSYTKKKGKESNVSQTFPPRFSTEGVVITGFRVEIYEYTPPVYGEDRSKK